MRKDFLRMALGVIENIGADDLRELFKFVDAPTDFMVSVAKQRSICYQFGCVGWVQCCHLRAVSRVISDFSIHEELEKVFNVRVTCMKLKLC